MEDVILIFKNQCQESLHALTQEFSQLRTNRPTPRLVEDIPVEYMGQMLTIKQLGSIQILPPRDIAIGAWDQDSVSAIAKAIENAPLGLSATIDGAVVRLRMPPLTEERRNDLVKIAKSGVEKARIRIRTLRDEANKKIEAGFKAKTISEDQKFKSRKQIQDATDTTNKEIEDALAKKTKEILE